MSYRTAGVMLFALLGIASVAMRNDTRESLLLSGTTLVEPRIPESMTGELRRLNVELSRDLTPSRNAGVYFVQIFGASAFEPELREESLAMLGIFMLSPKAPQLMPLDAYLQKGDGGDADQIRSRKAELQTALQLAIEHPWSAAKSPQVAEFIEANRGALDATVRIAELPHYYVPIISRESPPRITSAALSVETRLGGLVQFLTIRALRERTPAEQEASLVDLLACHRLAVLLATDAPFDLSQSKAHVIDASACHAATQLIRHNLLSASLARDYLKRLDALPRLPLAATAADRGERTILKQELELLERDETPLREYLEVAAEKKLVHLENTRLTDIKWNLALQRAMELQDRVVAALKVDDHRQQEEKFAELDREYDAWMEASSDLSKPVAGEVTMDLESASRWVGETSAMSLRSNYRQRRASDDRARLRHGMLRIGLALVAYAGDRGTYPETLNELAPKQLEKVPVDAHSDAPFVYERRADGVAVLTSWGRNQVNDAGNIFNDDTILELPAPAARR